MIISAGACVLSLWFLRALLVLKWIHESDTQLACEDSFTHANWIDRIKNRESRPESSDEVSTSTDRESIRWSPV